MAEPPFDMLQVAPLQARIGYIFKNLAFLRDALTHRSFCNEPGGKGADDNERLEFLGDAILGFFLSHLLLQQYPDSREGELSRIRAALVGEENLSQLADKIELGQFLRLGKGEEKSGGRAKRSLLANAYEALLAAIFLDGGEMAVKGVIERDFRPCLTSTHILGTRDSKTRFQEVAQALYRQSPSYRHMEPSGPDHDKVFSVSVFIGTECFGSGRGKTKKEAEQSAAKVGLERIQSPEEPHCSEPHRS